MGPALTLQFAIEITESRIVPTRDSIRDRPPKGGGDPIANHLRSGSRNDREWIANGVHTFQKQIGRAGSPSRSPRLDARKLTPRLSATRPNDAHPTSRNPAIARPDESRGQVAVVHNSPDVPQISAASAKAPTDSVSPDHVGGQP